MCTGAGTARIPAGMRPFFDARCSRRPPPRRVGRVHPSTPRRFAANPPWGVRPISQWRDRAVARGQGGSRGGWGVEKVIDSRPATKRSGRGGDRVDSQTTGSHLPQAAEVTGGGEGEVARVVLLRVALRHRLLERGQPEHKEDESLGEPHTLEILVSLCAGSEGSSSFCGWCGWARRRQAEEKCRRPRTGCVVESGVSAQGREGGARWVGAAVKRLRDAKVASWLAGMPSAAPVADRPLGIFFLLAIFQRHEILPTFPTC